MINFLNIKVAIRNARKDGVLSFAKLFGISISFAIILFAVAYVYYETSFDKCIPDNDKIYRCLTQGQLNGNDVDFAVTSSMMADAVLNEIPEVTESVFLTIRGTAVVFIENETIELGPLYYAESNVFEFFGFNIHKNIDEIFESENNIAIAKSVAIKYFNSVEGALNKVVRLRGDNCTITGVFDDLPNNFHLRTKIIQSIKDVNPEQDGWGQNYFTYIKTSDANINVEELNFKLTKTVYLHDNENDIDAINANNWEDLKFADNTYLFYNAEPLKDIHFSKHRFDPAITSNKTYVYGAIILAVLILLISSFNFINLTIANLSTRFKEVGIRKTNGANNKQIALQFIYESILFWLVGFALAMVIYKLGEETLKNYLGLEVNIADKGLVLLVSSIFIALLLFNLATNIIPIILFSKKETLSLLKKATSNRKQFLIKNSFVILQFALSALIILSSIFVQKQISFMINKDRGYDKDNIISFTMWEMPPETRKTFIEEIKTQTAIQSVSTSDVYFGTDPSMGGAFFETQEDGKYFLTSVLPVDNEFFKTFNLQLVEGRFFNKELKSDFEAVILNETAAKEYQEAGSLMGKNLILNGKDYTIAGIVKDFNFRSLYHKVQPLVIIQIENFGNVFVKVRNNQIPEALEVIRSKRKELNLTKPLDYEFHDEVIAEQYLKDQQAKKLLLFLSLVSVLIACVGLYAISFFTIIKRTKEIGIRRVNGAKVSEILTLLNRDFIKWVAIAFVVACPIAYFAMQKWLENFAYKTTLSWWIFALAGVLALGIALLTVSWQSWRAATRNPIEALRYE
jgi:putative ABC transport system permease protein